MNLHTKVLIIGSGPAGLTAAIYTSRAGLKPILISGTQPGGQLTISNNIENYPGFVKCVKGNWLMKQMINQAENTGTNIIYDEVIKSDLTKRPFKVIIASNTIYTADSIIISTGAEANWLNIPSEDYFKGHGVSTCATCDGFLFKNEVVLVIGGGNTAIEEALHLSNYAKNVFIVHRRNSFKAEQILQDKLINNKKISTFMNHKLIEIIGNKNSKTITSAKLQNIKTYKLRLVKCSGIFVAIGYKPKTDLFKNQINIDKDNYIITKYNSTATNIEGVFAAGDVQDKTFRQAITAASSGCMAALEVEKFLKKISIY